MKNGVKLMAISAVSVFALAGCTYTEPAAAPVSAGVDIVMPYATATPVPEKKQSEAMHIGADGSVTVNNDEILNNSAVQATAAPVETPRYSQLRFGDAGESVANMQIRLSNLGYYNGEITGIYDENTEAAVRLFERSYGIMQTGISTAALQERLFSDDAISYGTKEYEKAVSSQYAVLQMGDVGSAVIMLQTRLMELGYPVSAVTGVYDDETREAVRLFYKAHGQKQKNIATVDMQKKLYSDGATAYVPETATEAEAATDEFTLKQGDYGTRVAQIKIRLKELGYLSTALGDYDEDTKNAVAKFQRACNMEETGVADKTTQQMLYALSAPKYGERLPLYGLLQWGDSGVAVAKMQERLAELGFYAGEIDGMYTDSVVAAIKQFQVQAEQTADGVATAALQELMFSDDPPLSPELDAIRKEEEAAANTVLNPLMPGDISDDVTKMQTRLRELGYLNKKPDGDYGENTKNAVMAFQKALGVIQTGEASQNLLNIMYSDAAPRSGKSYWKTVTDYYTLRIGDSGDSVTNLQKRLWELGYLDKEDVAENIGLYEEYTAKAVNDAMKAISCPRRDGVASAEFQSYIFSSAADSIKIK